MVEKGLFEEIPSDKINLSNNPIREGYEAIENLAYSILTNGLINPITVRIINDRYEVIAGNRRLLACKLLKWKKIPCHVIELDDKEAFEFSLAENIQRKTLNPIEEARAFKKYVDMYGWGGVSNLARKIGKSQEYVSRRIQLLNLPLSVQSKIMRRRINPSIAQELLVIDPKTAEEIAELLDKRKLKRNEVRHLVKKVRETSIESVINNYDFVNTEVKEIDEIIDATLAKCISILKQTLMKIDNILDRESEEDWIVRQLLIQYRFILHGDIDTFIRLRKKLKAARYLTRRYNYKINDKGEINNQCNGEYFIYFPRSLL